MLMDSKLVWDAQKKHNVRVTSKLKTPESFSNTAASMSVPVSQ